MLFNSFTFLLFLPLTFLIYWQVVQRNLRLQNLFVLVASYVFYGWWDWRFLGLIAFSSAVDFWVGQEMHHNRNPRKKKALLMVSLGVNLGMLGVFKYADFFMHSLMAGLTGLGIETSWTTLGIILPVGISFYTFQTLSYTIDIYRGKLQPTSDPLTFFAFVSFFPQLVAGPIERATHLLPQFEKNRHFDFAQARKGLELILWGMFKKVVIADRLSVYVETVYGSPEAYSGLPVMLATLFFAFQIYCDFSGYSDIAIGTARLFGFDLMTNFRTPYFSTSLKEFWSRWHISLSTWFRDYVYIPLGGNRASTPRWMFNTMATFLVSGLWHGANWTFVVWGLVHGVFLAIESYLRKIGRLPKVPVFFSWALTFSWVCLAWVFFRADSVSTAFTLLAQMPVDLLSQLSSLTELEISLRTFINTRAEFTFTLLSLGLFLGLEAWMAKKDFAQRMVQVWKPGRWSLYYLLAFWMIYFGAFNQSAQFIYFQF
ncbi:MAG: MBOAT family protein [Bacteroidota bacterium]